MGCISCGEQPKSTGKDFTRAVIEINNPEQLVLLRKVSLPASMGTEEETPASVGKYRNVLLVYEANGHIYLYSSDGIPTLLSSDIGDLEEIEQAIAELQSSVEQIQGALDEEASARESADSALNAAITAEATARQNADNNLQQQIDGITASSDVKDIVGTKAELNNYDTSTLGNNDIIKVLQDESENDATTYYRWNATTQQFSLIGEEGPYYTKSQADILLNAKQNTLTAGSNVQIVGDTISATDTTYTAGNGLALNGTQFSADTTVLATQTDLAGKQDALTAGTGIDITNNVISATSVGPIVVQTTGNSTTDVMSQNAATSMVFVSGYDPATQPTATRIKIGGTGTTASGSRSVAIGAAAVGGGVGSIAIGGADGFSTQASSRGAIAIGGSSARATSQGAIALGYGALASATGEMNIGSNTDAAYGYNNSNYRLLTGLYDGQNDHDAVTVGQLNTAIAGAGAAEINSTDWSALWQ